ncbi:L,D-transpeptidase [Rubellimicrobium rubrum]|uniref:L,D-transpeptidase n=1 Tax=Rubellimicrobium rubrum TaxID=2585369 RepID=A0A5C4MT31_9RHOB|nr:L,D-transpeptidase [Rubellimicrobium rubrum]TNC49192.1 L,D-transpeptidase [Rubellimicrobium rubrum]
MLNRRKMLACSLATLGVGWSSAAAHESTDVDQGLSTKLQPRIVGIKAQLPPGEIHIDPGTFALYWTRPDLTAIRYPCAVGRPGLYEPGVFYVGAKKEWPRWTPTPEMVERDPDSYGHYAETGMPGGTANPLGARALYLHTPERGDTFLRIHGTNAPQTIGTAVSNGCARLLNEHIVDLYDMVPLNTRVVLYSQDFPLSG